MKLTVLLIDGEYEVHAAGCRDLNRKEARMSCGNRFNVSGETYEGVALDLWSDFLDEWAAEGRDANADALSFTRFLPCAKLEG